MWKKWRNKNITLKTLIGIISHFFKGKKIEVSVVKVKDGYQIVAFPSVGSGITEKIKVCVLGHPNEFKIEFDAGSKSRALVLLGNIFSLLGGGIFVKKGLENLKNIERLEKEFWIYADEVLGDFKPNVRHSYYYDEVNF